MKYSNQIQIIFKPFYLTHVTGNTTPCQNGPGSKGYEWVLDTTQNSSDVVKCYTHEVGVLPIGRAYNQRIWSPTD